MKWKVGDRVRVVPEPVRCAYVWVGGMDKYCGEIAIIEKIDGNLIKIDLDDGYFKWDENCFLPVKELKVDIQLFESIL